MSISPRAVGTLLEILARQLYWRLPAVRAAYQWLGCKRQAQLRCLDLERLRQLLASHDIGTGSVLMVHASTDHLQLIVGGRRIKNKVQVAAELLKFFRAVVGAPGTLLMPTHPHYPEDPGFMFDKADLQLTYDPSRTPSRVGLLTELFRRSPGTIRSCHPLSSVAASGPLAKAIIGGTPRPRDLPHGANSPYMRFCNAGGRIVGVNLSLISALTIVHVAEEVRDAEWPIDGFFYDRSFQIAEDGALTPLIVRERHPRWARNISLRTLRRDLIRARVVAEYEECGASVGIADAAGVVNYMLDKNAGTTYPYFLLGR